MSSWENVGDWYNKAVGSEGHYYHQHVVLPKGLRLLNLKKQDRLLDLACGQGILARHLPEGVFYTGIDLSNSLIKAAKKYQNKHSFFVGDITKPLPIKEKDFTHAAILLAIQNIAEPLQAFKQAYAHLVKGGKLLIVLNHPCFRIPRQSSWGIDTLKKLQYRRMDLYLSSCEIPIAAHPSQKEHSTSTISYHHSLSSYSLWLKEAGFVIELIEEWCSDKKSTGKMAAMENRGRKEFPLFLSFLVTKV